MNPADRIYSLADLLDGTSIVSLTLTGQGETITLRRDGAATPTPATVEAAPTLSIRSPSVGIFRTHHPMKSEPLAEPGRAVAAGDVVGLIQIGSLYVHVPAPAAGTVTASIAADGAVVGYGAPLTEFHA